MLIVTALTSLLPLEVLTMSFLTKNANIKYNNDIFKMKREFAAENERELTGLQDERRQLVQMKV